MAKAKKSKTVPEIPVIGEVDDWEADVIRALLEIPHGGECVLYIDSAGGSVYGALAVLALMRHRPLQGGAGGTLPAEGPRPRGPAGFAPPVLPQLWEGGPLVGGGRPLGGSPVGLSAVPPAEGRGVEP